MWLLLKNWFHSPEQFLLRNEIRWFGRWLRQAPYLAQCGSLAGTPHAPRLTALPPMEQYAAVELWRGNMLRHSLIAYRDDALIEELSFKVFQGPQFNRNDKDWFYEPREVASGDLNADGLMDLGILVHDKLVIHLGE